MAASVEEFVELLSSEQHVDIARLRHLSRHGVHPAVRGEVWMYLLGVLSPDKSQEMTSVRALYNTYDGLFSSYSHPRSFSSKVSDLIRQEAERVWRHRVPHDFDYLRGDQRTQYDASSSHHPPELPKAKEGSIGRSLPTKAKGARDRGPLRPIRAMNCHGLPSNAGSGPIPSSTSSLAAQEHLSQAAIEHDELKQHFIKRIHNVLSVWIGRKSSEQREAAKLRERLLQEASVARQDEASGSGDLSSEETLYPGNLLSANETASEGSSLTSRDADTRPYAVALRRSGESEEVSTPRPPRQHSEWPVEQSAGYARSLPGRVGHPSHVEEQAVDDDSGEEPFDPAMGMGVEDNDDYGYPDDLAPFDSPHAHVRNRSRADSKRDSSRLAHQASTDGDSNSASDGAGLGSSVADSQPIPIATANGEDQVGLGVSGWDQSKALPSSSSSPSQQNSSRFHTRLHSSGRPRSPHSGYTSPHRARAGHLGSLSPRPRSRGSPSSAGSDEEADGEEEESRAIDEELLQIQERLWSPHLVQLASPFVLISGKKRVEAGIFFAFDKLMTLIESRRKAFPISHILATFHSLLRRTLPDLRAYFDDEGLDVTPFVKGWLESLFSGQMKLNEGGCLRLWDAYFSSLPTMDLVSSASDQNPPPAGAAMAAKKGHYGVQTVDDGENAAVLPPSSSTPLSLHLYVCLAILLHCKDTLEELDRSECESFLRGLPDLDVEKILNEAANLRLSHRQAILTCGEGEGDVDVDGYGKEQGQREMERAIWREIMVEEEVVGQVSGAGEGFAEEQERSS
ncbi:hypothetical protein BCV69DRAFT_284682 [Microstroma glucosiphilum]|uniref:Rab-GAP TBC domain-containing protein n=1 Tax=Pseudomicrostroma glucosiphilum TaxID=1684307 RepID=A0A316U1G8_9BASI|nr:hypothetical protein BCV69DRAFT_284682 [Pseudomicrostroma glucosiphilum]PWN18698.1 hypothetical protein BCV69DRAFT_284682 [Pseudomicrostroma glucosiphilum]